MQLRDRRDRIALLAAWAGAWLFFASPPVHAQKSSIKTVPATAAPKSDLPTLEEARATAQRSRKTLVLEFGARWCAPCKEFEKRVLPQPAVQRAISGVLYVAYDAEVGTGQAAARTLKIVGYPTFVAIGQGGREIDRIEGFRTARQFIDWVGRVAVDFESDESLQVRISKTPSDAEALLILGRRQAQRGEDALAEPTLEKARTAAQQISANPGAGPNRAELLPTIDWELRVVRLRRILREAPRKEMAEHLEAFPRSSSAEAALHELTRSGTPDPLTLRALERYIAVRIDGKEAKDRDALNEAIYRCLRIGAYSPAEHAARRLVELDEKSPLYLDTLAEVMHLRGDKAQAEALSARALIAAERQGEDGKELRVVLLKNQARFARAAHELPAELLGEDDDLSPWERPITAHR